MPRGGDPSGVRSNGIFIGVEVDDAVAHDTAVAAKLAEVCPVDIYGVEGGHSVLHEENLDECVLCGLCLDAAPDGAVRVLKLYDDGAALQRA
jgi:NAD-dependent dihydropyrimidine dehydrogenase PreA subunit